MKKILTVLILTAILLSAVGCMGNQKVYEADAKDFTSNGMTVTLTEAFRETEQQGYTVCYDSNAVAVFALKEAFSLQAGISDWTLEYYADLVKQSNAAHSPSDPVAVGDRMVMEYTFYNPNTDITYHYYTCMYKGSDAFWLIQFACDVTQIDEYREHMISWADSVRFD